MNERTPRNSARRLRHRITFARRADEKDGYGNTSGGWDDQFTVWAGLTYLRGTETVIASRLQGRQPVVIRVRASDQTRRITADWRAQDAAGKTFNVRSIIPTDDRRFLDMATDTGGAD